jgi:uncharacterized membrane protein
VNGNYYRPLMTSPPAVVHHPSSMMDAAAAIEMETPPEAALARSREQRWLAVQAPALLLGLAAAILYAGIGIYRHGRFGSAAYDLGIQDQTVWGYSHLQMIPNTVLGIRNPLGDHFNPILMSLAPLYWIWSDPRMLLVAQAAILAVAGIPIFLWSRERLGLAVALAIQGSYLAFWGLLAGVVFDFHHIVFAVAAVSFAIYGLLERRDRLLWAAIAVGLLTREDIALTLAALGVYAAVVQRRRRLGLAIVAICAGWFVALLRVVIPAIGGGPYLHWTYDALGSGPASAAVHVIRHPLQSAELFFSPAEKLKTLGALLSAWLFLPVLSPLFLLALPGLAERFWSSNEQLWTTHYHYSLVAAPILAFAAADTLARAARWWTGRRRRALLVAAAAALPAANLLLSGFLVRPLAELGTYVSSGRAAEIQSCLDTIPAGASVAASPYLVPHLTHRAHIYPFISDQPAPPRTDYVAIDLSTPPHLPAGDAAFLRAAIRAAMASGHAVTCSKGETIVLGPGVAGRNQWGVVARSTSGPTPEER